jgi:para-aminobenzoate synthetase/4-amino-4-deoxychorismate lyase
VVVVPLSTRFRQPCISVLLDDGLAPDHCCSLFEEPIEIVRCDAPAEVDAVLRRLEDATAAGLHAAGFLAYELGYLLEPRLAPLLPENRDQPLIWMGLFRSERRLSSSQALQWIERQISGGYELSDLRLSISRDSYSEKFQQVLRFIEAGDAYQVNLTLKHLFRFRGDPLALYRDLRRRQPVAHGAVISTPAFSVLSLSPELFVRIADGVVEARPMKGTAARGSSPEDDERLRRWLARDEKSRAENLMIVDLLRNDIGRIAETGSVRVPDLFTVETYPTVHQMTSGITARLRQDVGTRALLHSIFPCGSITGAPKIRAMEIIRALEPMPRGVYTGAIGAIGPDRRARFNVAIRTLMLHADGRGEMGIGSGLVYDSVAEAEFEECLLKARFLTEPWLNSN